MQEYRDIQKNGGGGISGYRYSNNCLAIGIKKTFSYRDTMIQGYTDT